MESFLAIGDNIRKTQEIYNQALGRLHTGNGNLVAQAQKLQELGIKSKKGGKEIPKELLSKEESIY